MSSLVDLAASRARSVPMTAAAPIATFKASRGRAHPLALVGHVLLAVALSAIPVSGALGANSGSSSSSSASGNGAGGGHGVHRNGTQGVTGTTGAKGSSGAVVPGGASGRVIGGSAKNSLRPAVKNLRGQGPTGGSVSGSTV